MCIGEFLFPHEVFKIIGQYVLNPNNFSNTIS
jgi:hypothetical protein